MKNKIIDFERIKRLLVSDITNEIDLMKTTLATRILEMPDADFATLSEFISPKKAAELIGVSIPTLNKFVAEGKVKRYRLGRKRYYRRDEIKQAFFNDFLNKEETINELPGNGRDC